MNATQNLPEEYKATMRMDLTQDSRFRNKLNLFGMGLLVLLGILFIQYVITIRPGDFSGELSLKVSGFQGVVQIIGIIVLVFVAMIILHEGIHGVFFWIYTHSRPVFSFKVYYASASAPGWYLSKGPFLITTLAPVVVLTALGMLLLAVIPANLISALLFFMILNGSGAVGDLIVAYYLLRQPPTCLVLDEGHAVTLYNLPAAKKAR